MILTYFSMLRFHFFFTNEGRRRVYATCRSIIRAILGGIRLLLRGILVLFNKRRRNVNNEDVPMCYVALVVGLVRNRLHARPIWLLVYLNCLIPNLRKAANVRELDRGGHPLVNVIAVLSNETIPNVRFFRVRYAFSNSVCL